MKLKQHQYKFYINNYDIQQVILRYGAENGLTITENCPGVGVAIMNIDDKKVISTFGADSPINNDPNIINVSTLEQFFIDIKQFSKNEINPRFIKLIRNSAELSTLDAKIYIQEIKKQPNNYHVLALIEGIILTLDNIADLYDVMLEMECQIKN